MTDHISPNSFTFDKFCEVFPVKSDDVFDHFFDHFKDRIKVQRRTTAVRNLEKIYKAAFALSSRKGFQSMSLRDLCSETGLSMGGMYNYISSKDDLLAFIENFSSQYLRNLGIELVKQQRDPRERLEMVIRLYVFMGELFRPWYHFLYFESKNMPAKDRELLRELDNADVSVLRGLILECQASGHYRGANPDMAATTLLALLQNWYVKHWQYSSRNITADDYCDYLVPAAQAILNVPTTP